MKRRIRVFRLLFWGTVSFCCCNTLIGISAIRTRLTWSNGIGYKDHHMETDGKKISKIFGAPVSYCFNPSAMANDDDMMGYLNDLTQAGTQKLGRITMEVETLVKHLKDAVAFVGKKGRVIHIAHSQGALITFLASKQLSPLEMNRIEIVAFGGAAALRQTPETPFHRCINYYSVNDPLLWVVPSAEQALRSGLVVDDEFCFLAPKVGDPIQDHHLLNPTYAQALSWEGHRYRRTYQSIVYRSAKWLLTLVAALLEMIISRVSPLLRGIQETIIQPLRIWLRAVLALLVRGFGKSRQSSGPTLDDALAVSA